MGFNIAIDGPAGAGKSTIAKRVAKELSFIYVDTGAMYRAVALYLIKNGISPEDEAGLLRACGQIHISIEYENGEQQVILNGENVTGQLRNEEVGNMASAAAAKPCVRETLLTLQRDLAVKADVLMDGRDIGTNILPDAQLKIYLTASVETRAGRRFRELQEKGEACTLEAIAKDIEERDRKDMSRETAPLKMAEDAVLVDSSEMDIEEVAARIISLYRERR
ncbi:MAG: (d)CMP kinase [Lachnospiraceae bacterium]|jgi:cytidylate kinase|uniref:(D)CMP kinase n=1 Tax=Hominisplanchenecus murintestinalis TaxID=2941517 RepID=A0AC61R545_9FIRM|nr:(d)CMP kinase [Hominisplanchenecus murintestinalis]MCI9516176.1 (d)CMP kinase [Lachnospiraceae bacterium]RKJ94063.1 (d)CMP kinase [Anaerotruncus sp. 1XD22-93]MCI9661974.1 (d)CMP kinase [Lachnospiraceae bacterium]NBH97123.1 (d)CMP kinase [Lachnospiraceae bacterium]NBI75122.1 (d)CMP kinase [Lachnospiraceae bacterium]